MKNPLQFGRELAPLDLVDRQDEIAACVRTVQNRERLFLIGPRRYGKTSILKAASETLRQGSAIVFRYNAEAYPTIEMLVSRLVTDATEKLAGGYEKASEKVRKVFARLRPEVSFSVTDGTWSATLGVASQAPGQQTHVLVDGLGGVERLAAEASTPVGIALDEFQHLIESGGRRAAAYDGGLYLRQLEDSNAGGHDDRRVSSFPTFWRTPVCWTHPAHGLSSFSAPLFRTCWLKSRRGSAEGNLRSGRRGAV
jgi:hypothetical protein